MAKITLKRCTNVPNKNGSTNFGGLASRGNILYACKTNHGETTTTIYKFKNYLDKNPEIKKFPYLGHANGMTYWNGNIYVPGWGSTINQGGIFKINFENQTVQHLNGITTGAVAHYTGRYFVIRKSSAPDKRYFVFSVVKIVGNKYVEVRNFRVNNPYYKTYNVNQDIYYKDGKLYLIQCNESFTSNAVLIANVDKMKKSSYTVSDIWTYDAKNEHPFEFESMTIDKDGHALLALNAVPDGIFQKID